jgi:hypothetical protein
LLEPFECVVVDPLLEILLAFAGLATRSGAFNRVEADPAPDLVDHGQCDVFDRINDDLDPSDIVNVEGIPMTVAQAKAAGYSFDGEEPIPVESSANPRLANDEDQATELDLREEGAGTDAEIVALDNVVTAAQMHTGLDEEATIELGSDILTGELKADDPIWNDLQQRGVSRDAAHGAISQVVQVGQQAALRELGAAEYNELSRLADNSPAIKAVVIKHGVARMQGRTKNVTWKHVLTLARQFARA